MQTIHHFNKLARVSLWLVLVSISDEVSLPEIALPGASKLASTL